MTYIKTLTAPLIIIAGLALLTACGGTPAVNIGEVNINNGNPCTDDIFDSPDMCADEKNTFCAMPANIFTHTECSNLDNINDIRTTFCALPANIFAHAECENISNINDLRKTFCEMPDNLFNAMCISGGLGGNERDAFCKQSTNRFVQGCIDNMLGDNGRDSFCAIPGNRFNQMCIDNGLDGAGRGNWCADPANRFNQMCIDNNLGDNERANFCAMPVRRFEPDCITRNLGGDGRTTFCAMSENRFNMDCIDNMLGGDGRTTFCEMTENRFNMDCIDNNLGDNDRDTFCAMLPANRFVQGCIDNMLGDNERDTFCGMPANRFDPGCIAIPLGGDDRTSFCNMPDNLFVKGCTDNGLGSDTDRDNACLMHGTGADGHSTCPMRPEVIKTCKMNPFDATNPGCADIPTIGDIQDTYCTGGNSVDSIADGSTTNECNVNYADWTGGFTGTLATAISTTDNHFLGDVTPASGLTNLDLNTAKFDGRALGGDVESGLGFSTNTDGEEPTYQAGIFTTSNLGRPIETTTGTAKWNGSFRATNMDTAADFTLHIDFSDREIAGIVRDGASANNYYYVNGNYTAGSTGGLIIGTVQYGEFTATAIDLTTATPTLPASSGTPTSGILSGIIGQEGAIGVFVSGSAVDTDGLITGGKGDTGYAGGFVVNPVAKIIPIVNYGDWARGFGVTPPPTPATSPALNQFLNAGADRLESAAVGEDAPPALDFAINVYKITRITNVNEELYDAEAAHGVAWFDTNSTTYYAGIFPTTDLGLPVTGKTATTAMWSGQFQATGMASAVDFDLEVTFGTVAGFPSSVGGIAAFVASDSNHYLLSGTYTADGVISGTVNFGAFTDRNRAVPTNNDATRKGILTGLIGANGAVGAFVSGTAISPDGVIMDGTGGTGYAGGFVASPFEGKVSYRDWVRLASPNATPGMPDNPQTENLNQFVQSIGNDANSAAHVGQNFNVNLGSLNGDPADGFNVYHITATDDYLVGLSSSTSVGAALTTPPAAAWDGSFVVYENGVATTTPFKLNINFSTSQLSATVGDYSFSAVEFGSNGLFRSSNMTHTPTSITGSLQGLIGSEGAVGVFISDRNAMDNGVAVSFAGGFVAASPPCITLDNCVNHANWLGIFGASPPPATRVAANAGTAAFGGFLNLAEGVRDISETGLTHRNANTHLTLDGDETNGRHGVTYLTGRSTANFNQAFVAVLPTTNLGAPLASPPAITTWPGKFYHTSIEDTPTVNFEIDFNGTAITATPSVEILTGVFRTTTFALRFTPATGVITGNVTNGVGVSATARGLIGEAGLVGVYVQESPSQAENTGVYFGGFVADNPNN